MTDRKTIVINGKHTNDVLNVIKIERIRIGCSDTEIDYSESLRCLCIDDDTYMRAIKNKLLGYKYQDNKKNLRDQSIIISLQEVKQKLLDCDLKCHYCNKLVKVIYRIVRDPLQWTLDRIDNKKNHSNVNTLIACLHCNLKRRNINKDKFEFSQNINIVKVE